MRDSKDYFERRKKKKKEGRRKEEEGGRKEEFVFSENKMTKLQ